MGKLPELKDCSLSLKTYTGESVKIPKEGLGTWTGPPAKIHVNKNAVPRYYKHRPVPYALKRKKSGNGVRAITQ